MNVVNELNETDARALSRILSRALAAGGLLINIEPAALVHVKQWRFEICSFQTVGKSYCRVLGPNIAP